MPGLRWYSLFHIAVYYASDKFWIFSQTQALLTLNSMFVILSNVRIVTANECAYLYYKNLFLRGRYF